MSLPRAMTCSRNREHMGSSDIKFITVRDDRSKIQLMFANMARTFAEVGYPGNLGQHVAVTERTDSGRPKATKPGPLTIAEVAAIHEFGSPANNIPKRPFMQQTWDRFASQTKNLVRRVATDCLNFRMSPRQGMGIAGEWFNGRLKWTIRNGEFAPLKEATKIRKGSSRPLIDTAQLRNSSISRVGTK